MELQERVLAALDRYRWLIEGRTVDRVVAGFALEVERRKTWAAASG